MCITKFSVDFSIDYKTGKSHKVIKKTILTPDYKCSCGARAEYVCECGELCCGQDPCPKGCGGAVVPINTMQGAKIINGKGIFSISLRS
jgi:hypothetical protein